MPNHQHAPVGFPFVEVEIEHDFGRRDVIHLGEQARIVAHVNGRPVLVDWRGSHWVIEADGRAALPIGRYRLKLAHPCSERS